MNRVFVLLLLATPAPADEPAPWKVEFKAAADDVATMLVCVRAGEHDLICADLTSFIEARDAAVQAEAELEAKKAEQRHRWMHGDMEL